MFTSEKNNKAVLRTLLIYVGISAFVAIFGFVYEMFSNHVYSASMMFAFRYPLILGCVMYFFIFLLHTKRVPGLLVSCLYHFGVAMATCKAIFTGVIEIYGTTNTLMTNIYTVLAWVFVLLSMSLYVFILVYWTINNKPEMKAE